MTGRRPARTQESRALAERFRQGLVDVLGNRLKAGYLIGSIVFERTVLRTADVDFYVVTHRALGPRDKEALGRMHRDLSRRFPPLQDLDGYYLSTAAAKSTRRPRGLVYAQDGRVRPGRLNETWALDRAHLWARAVVRIAGGDPRGIFRRPAWREIARELDREGVALRKDLARHPTYSVLNLCRLMHTWATRDPVTSKRASGEWARTALPADWRDLIDAALRAYRGRDGPGDRRVLRTQVRLFFEFARSWIRAARKTG